MGEWGLLPIHPPLFCLPWLPFFPTLFLTPPSPLVFSLLLFPPRFFGHTWQGCGSPDVDEPTQFPLWHSELYDADFGIPQGACVQSSPSFFTRQWSKAQVSLNCSDAKNGFNPIIHQ